ncbi:aspartic proteinase nepenthesin-2-like [Papaver somniferum]|uniref:aspartic proteinase nepenthesin-2-like n=1 Tax=Papaver somniferum TaxID=3469 RepID=UPI000E705729|nr:aspartic proteinase nepenthesin-2-like [Papaver somniferum]
MCPLYPWKSSTTYHPVPCNTHPLCKGDKCNADGQCTYVAEYMSGSITYGIIAKEKFTLGSDTDGIESIELHMGCGFLQQNFEKFICNNHLLGKPDLIAVILGLGLGPRSFLNQLGVIGQGKKVHTTPIVIPKFKTPLYYLNLEDISVGNKRMGFPKGTFELNSQGNDDIIIDFGAPISIMYKDHFDRVVDLVKAHFNDLGIEYIGSHGHFDVCFRLRGRFDITNYPSITLH